MKNLWLLFEFLLFPFIFLNNVRRKSLLLILLTGFLIPSTINAASYKCDGQLVANVNNAISDASQSYTEDSTKKNRARYFRFKTKTNGKITINLKRNYGIFSSYTQLLEIGTSCKGSDIASDEDKSDYSKTFNVASGTWYYIRVQEKNRSNQLKFEISFNFQTRADLKVLDTASPSPDPVNVGENVVFKLSTQNRGPHTAYNNILVKIKYNQDVEITSATYKSGSDFSCDKTSGNLSAGSYITCTKTNLWTSITNTKKFEFTVKPSTTGTLTQTATIESTTTTDPDTSNNTLNTDVQVVKPNHVPTDISLSNNSINENNSIGDVIGTLSTTDADSGDSFTYTLVSGDTTAFTIDGDQLKAAEVFDYETKNSYSVRIKTDDGNGGTFEKNFTITINDVGEADISLTEYQSATPNPVDLNSEVTFYVRGIKDSSHDSSPNIELRISFDHDVDIVSIDQVAGGSEFENCDKTSGTLTAGSIITCTKTTTLATGAPNKDVSIKVKPKNGMSITLTAQLVPMTTSDPNMGNNIVNSTVNINSSCGSKEGLNADYFNNKTLSGSPVLSRTDDNIDFDWGSGSPDSNVNSNNFSARWTGYIRVPEDANYTFSANIDDHFKIIIDGNTVLNKGYTAGKYVDGTTVSLSAGCHTFKAEFVENTGGAKVVMRWRNDASITSDVVVPKSVLFSNDAKPVIDNADDLCYDSVKTDGFICVDLGPVNGGIMCTQTVSIKNWRAEDLSNVTTVIDMSGFNFSTFDDCGINGTSTEGSSCHKENSYQFGPTNLFSKAIIYDPMPDYSGGSSNTIYEKSLMDVNILSAQKLYATYEKNGKQYRGKLNPCQKGYCETHNLSEGFHVIDPNGGDKKDSFEIYCDRSTKYEPRDLIALPIKTPNNDNNNFVYNNHKPSTVNYYAEAKNNSKSFQAIEINANTMEVLTRSDGDPLTTGSYSTLGTEFSNINLIATPFGIDWGDINITQCDVSKLRKAYHGQAVKINLLEDYKDARCEIKKIKLKLLDDYQYLTYLNSEVLEYSCKEMSEKVPSNVLNSADIKGHFWITPHKHDRSYSATNITDAANRPIVAYCWYQTDLNWAWTFLMGLDGVVTNSKNDIINKTDTCSQLGLNFFVPNSKETFNRVRKYLKKMKTGDQGWENYTGTVREKYKTYHNNPNKEYYLYKLGFEQIWPYGPLGIYYPCGGNQDATNGCTKRTWYPGKTNVKGWMSGSPMNSSDSDGMGQKGWVSILGEQDLNVTNNWWISDIGAGAEFGPDNSSHTYSYDPHGTHILTNGGYPYYEPNGNYSKFAWLNFLHDSNGWVYHNDDNNNFYAYYDYMCMAETNYIEAERYILLPGFFNVIERGTRTGNTLVNTTTRENFYDDNLTTQLVKDTIQLDLILYDFNTSGNHVTINRTLLSRDLNKSVGVFLAKNSDKTGQLQLIKYLGEYENFDAGKGRLSITDFESNAAYKNVFIHFFYCNPADQNWKTCWNYNYNTSNPIVTKKNDYAGQSDSYDRFSIRPKNFTITPVNPGKVKAGNDFNLTLQALNATGTPTQNYNEPVTIVSASPTLDYNITKIGCSTKHLTAVSDTNFTNGVATISLSYDDVGDLNITLHEVQGSEFAKVDLNDTDFSLSIDDSPQTVNDKYRAINSATTTVSFIPDHFEINATLTDYKAGKFTYISKDLNMSSTLDINISAKNRQNDTTLNYNNGCYSKDINFSIGYLINGYTPESNIHPKYIHKLFYLINDDNDSNPVDTNVPNQGIDLSSNFKIKSTNSPHNTSKIIFNTDHNGSAHLNIKLNFDRQINKPTNPFVVDITDINVSDEDSVLGSNTVDTNATYLYARAKATQSFYDDIDTNSTKTPVMVQVYCNKWPADTVNCPGVDTTHGQTNEQQWWISTAHNTSNNDGNITLKAGTTDPSSATATVTPVSVFISSGGIDNTVTVKRTSGTVPMTVEIDLDTTHDTDTNSWLIYNPYSNILPASPFYKVRFIGNMDWAGYGSTGHVVNTKTSIKKNKKMGW